MKITFEKCISEKYNTNNLSIEQTEIDFRIPIFELLEKKIEDNKDAYGHEANKVKKKSMECGTGVKYQKYTSISLA